LKKSIRASELAAMDVIDQTTKVFERAVKNSASGISRSKDNSNNNGSFGFGTLGLLTLSSLGIAYVAFNCCYLEWCKQNTFLGTDLFHCSK